MKYSNITWRAYYNDGTVLNQFEDGKVNGYDKIDRSKLVGFSLLNDSLKIATVHLKPEQRLIWRKRVLVKPGAGEIVIHLMGWQQTINGENVQSMLYVFPDGRLEMAGKFDENHLLFGNVKLLNSEL